MLEGPSYHAASCLLAQLVKLELTVFCQTKKMDQRVMVVVADPVYSKNLWGSYFEKSHMISEKNYGCCSTKARRVVSMIRSLVDNCWHLGSRLGTEAVMRGMGDRMVLMIYEVVGKEIGLDVVVALAVVVLECLEDSMEM